MHVFSVGNDEFDRKRKARVNTKNKNIFLKKKKKNLDNIAMVCRKLLKVLNIAEVPCIKLRGLFDLLAVRNYTTISSTTVGTSLTHLDRKNWTPMNQQYTLGRPQIFLNDL